MQLKRRVIVAAATVGIGVAIGCSGKGGGGGLFGGVVSGALAPSWKTAPKADLSGQEDVHTGRLESGVWFSFNAVKGVNYIFSVSSKRGNDELVVDIFNKAGGQLKGKSIKTNGQMGYTHDEPTQHVLVLLRPAGPTFDTSVEITRLRVTGLGPYDQNKFNVNFVVAGDSFAGYGLHNDLKSTADRAAFTNLVMGKVAALLKAKNITVTYEGFSMTAAQVKATHPTLVDDTNRSVARASENLNSTGFSEVDTSDLDRWGSFGFAANDPVASRANGIDVFVVHHFQTDGVVGLSPRPGTVMKGNGPGSALCVAAFLKQGNQFIGRNADEIAVVLTHELGHFLGLLHTTTFTPNPQAPSDAIDDGLSDTPAAGTLTDKNKDGIVGLGDGCADEGNIMFYQAGKQSVLTDKQATVMRCALSSLEH